MFGRNQHFAFAEQKLSAVALEHHPVLGRDEQIPLLTSDDAGFDPDRGKTVHRRHSALLDPTNWLQAVVTGHNKITNLEGCDVARARWRGNACAGGKADDVFDLGEFQERAIIHLNRTRIAFVVINACGS